MIPAPSTGSVVISSIETTATDQEIKQKFKTFVPALRAMCKDTRNVIAPNSEESPSTCRKRIARLTAELDEKSIPVKG